MLLFLPSLLFVAIGVHYWICSLLAKLTCLLLAPPIALLNRWNRPAFHRAGIGDIGFMDIEYSRVSSWLNPDPNDDAYDRPYMPRFNLCVICTGVYMFTLPRFLFLFWY